MNAGIYIRKSRKDKDKPSHRLTVQREQLPAHARAQGWTVETYDDGHASAARGKTEDLRQRARLQSDIIAGKINIILVIELSRLSRDDSLQDYVAWLHLCSQHRVKLATMSRILDPAQNSDWMLLLMEGGFSSVEMRQLTARMRDGREQARREGRWLGGVCPLPYRYDHHLKRPVLDPAHADTYRTILNMGQTLSATQIVRQLNLPAGRVHRMFHNDRLLFYQGLRKNPDTGELISCQWDPILTPEQAELIRANRDQTANRHPSTGQHRGKSLLSSLGLFTCGHCGQYIQSSRHRSNPHRRGYYICAQNTRRNACPDSRSILHGHVDPLVIRHICTTLGNYAKLHQYWLDAQGDTTTGQQLRCAEERLTELHKQKQRLIAAIKEDIITLADAKTEIQAIDTEATHLGQQIGRLQSQLHHPDWETLAITVEEFSLLDLADQRDIISLVARKITLTATHITITYQFPIKQNGSKTASIPLPKRGTRLRPGLLF